MLLLVFDVNVNVICVYVICVYVIYLYDNMMDVKIGDDDVTYVIVFMLMIMLMIMLMCKALLQM